MDGASCRAGRLLPGGDAPEEGEAERELASGDYFAVRQVLSGHLGGPVAYDQAEDEWALLVAGSATLEVGDERHELVSGDWVWLPAGTPHVLVRTEPATSWVTVHARAPGEAGPGRPTVVD